MTKTALIVSPYLDHLGGGERYLLEAASVIADAGYQVYFAWNNLAQIIKLAKMLSLKLRDPHIDSNVPSYSSRNPLKMWQATRGYDLVFYLSDGSIPLLGGKHNYLHLQVPFHGVRGRSPLTQLKLSMMDKVIVNSRFTKRFTDTEYAVDSVVVYPPIQKLVAGKKKKLILSVGRFDPSLNVKRQDVLIDAFRTLHQKLPTWRLALTGASTNQAWVDQLTKKAKDLPIKILPNLPYQDLVKLYSEASIYWHAAGYQVKEEIEPELTEHFGIAVAEAISASCVPLVVPKGGQREIVRDSDYHWHTIDGLVRLTLLAVRGKLVPQILPTHLLSPFAVRFREVLP